MSEHFEWLVQARFKSQDILRRLYAFWKDQSNGEDLHSRDHDRAILYTLFVGAAFSLWRAAFLSDTERTWKQILNHTGELLKILLEDNAITYPADRKTKEWMGGYYMNNALFRLSKARDLLKMSPDSRAMTEFDKLSLSGIEDRKPTDSWDVLHDALYAMFKEYQKSN